MEQKPRWYEYDGTLMRAFRTLGELVVTNLFFILGALPVVTLGASVLALTSFYQQRCAEGGQGYTCRTFWHLWRQYLRRGLLLSLVLLVSAGIFVLDIIFLESSALPLSSVLLGVLYAVGALLGAYLVCLLPQLTNLSLTWPKALEGALIQCLMHIGRALVIVAAWVVLYLLCGMFLWFLIAILPIFLLIGFSSAAFLTCRWLDGR